LLRQKWYLYNDKILGQIVRVKYDKEVDAAYNKFSSKKPDGTIEMAEGVILYTTSKDKIVAIQILGAARKISIKTLYKLESIPTTASRPFSIKTLSGA
jgi:uncharacterized protein YuzE